MAFEEKLCWVGGLVRGSQLIPHRPAERDPATVIGARILLKWPILPTQSGPRTLAENSAPNPRLAIDTLGISVLSLCFHAAAVAVGSVVGCGPDGVALCKHESLFSKVRRIDSWYSPVSGALSCALGS